MVKNQSTLELSFLKIGSCGLKICFHLVNFLLKHYFHFNPILAKKTLEHRNLYKPVIPDYKQNLCLESIINKLVQSPWTKDVNWTYIETSYIVRFTSCYSRFPTLF